MTGHSTSVLVPWSCFGFRPSIISFPQRGTAALYFSAHVCCGQTFAYLSYCWALVTCVMAKFHYTIQLAGIAIWSQLSGWIA